MTPGVATSDSGPFGESDGGPAAAGESVVENKDYGKFSRMQPVVVFLGRAQRFVSSIETGVGAPDPG
jgi:hypothetical protein